MFIRPKIWLEWFLVKPWRRWGVTVSVTDERKFTRRMRLAGSLVLLGGLGMIVSFVVGGAFSPK